MTRHIDLRGDQVLFNHGPGSILETTSGPVVVGNFGLLEGRINRITNGSLQFPLDFEILESRLARLLPRGEGGHIPRLHRVPSNQELDSASAYVMSTREFPNWYLCRNPSHTHGAFHLFQGGARCPECPDDEFHSPIRFVTYCRNGHMDDFNWDLAMHRGRELCQGATYRWEETSSAMSGIHLTCSECGTHRSLNQISHAIPQCSGRHPQSERRGDPVERPGCTERPILTLRQSSVLWQSSLRRVITIPHADSVPNMITEFLRGDLDGRRSFDNLVSIGKLFREGGMSSPPDSIQPSTGDPEDFIHYLADCKSQMPANRAIRVDSLMAVCQDESGLAEVRTHYERLSGAGSPLTIVDSMRAEYRGLTMGAGRRPTIENDDRTELNRPNRTIFRIGEDSVTANLGELVVVAEPVTTLRSVTALHGFYRGALDSEDADPEIQPIRFNDDGQMWYPASESFGEGILMWLHADSPEPVRGQRWQVWEDTHNRFVEEAMEDPNSVRSHLFRSHEGVDPGDRLMTSESLVESCPDFVLWHTIAHHMIRVVQAETGYSSSSISERIYVVNREGRREAAILLYVTQGGVDGTLGGLTSLLPNLQSYFDSLVANAEVCSNDPLCRDTTQPVVPSIGCYACTLNPETSCEHRNLFLDRLLMLESLGV